MKQIKTPLLLVALSLSFSACNSPTDPYEGRIKSLEFEVADFSGVHYFAEDPDFGKDIKALKDYCSQDTIKMYYLDEFNDVYYVPLATYASLFDNNLKQDHKSTIEENGATSTWTIKKGDELIYRLSLDANKKTMSIDGDNYVSFLNDGLEGKIGVYDLSQIVNEYVEGYENKTKHYSFENYGFDVFEADGEYCYPFALIQLGLAQVAEHSFLFDTYDRMLFEYGVTDQFNAVRFYVDEQKGNPIDAMSYLQESYYKQYGDEATQVTRQPKALTEFNKKLFYFLMDSFYGIASQKGIRSMSEYFENFDYSANFLSDDGTKRAGYYYRAVNMLNDLHSCYITSKLFTENPGREYNYEQTFEKDRNGIKAYLSSERQAMINAYNKSKGSEKSMNDMRYSEDGKYGFFSFDDFNTYNHFGDGPVPEETLLKDAFHLFVRNFQEAKEKGVKRIIIDDSTNAGGYVSIMGKVLALMSKDNKSETFQYSDDNGSILKSTIRVDSNKDGIYDERDCFGNDFEFYILASAFSFSCGNSFPFYAKQNNLATIMGRRSGGGECCILEYTFPSGQSLRYSSPYHVGNINKDGNFVGAEYGADVKFGANDDLYNLYDVDFVGNYLDAHDPIKA